MRDLAAWRLDKLKKFDLIKLKNKQAYDCCNMVGCEYGIVIDCDYDSADVLFFNPQNVGDYAIVQVKIKDLDVEKQELPSELKNELALKLDNILSKCKQKFEPLNVKEYDIVELIVEDEKYVKYGVHKGDRGCIISDRAIKNNVEVDFSGIDKNGKFHGQSLLVNIVDLKVIK